MNEEIVRIWIFDDSPDVGDDECLCSLCHETIEDYAIRMFVTDDKYPHMKEMRFHEHCFLKTYDIHLNQWSKKVIIIEPEEEMAT